MNPTTAHDDFSDLDDLDNEPVQSQTDAVARIQKQTYFERGGAAPAKRDYSTAVDDRPRARCWKCEGRGVVRFGMQSGRCFACNGTGKGKLLDDKSVKARASRAKRVERVATDNRTAAETWLAANPGRAEWLRKASLRGFDMLDKLIKYGSLSENQIAAVDKCMARDIERNATRAAEQAARTVTVTGAGMDKLIAMFTRALDGGLKRPALAIGEIKLNPAKPTGRNPGAIYVKLNGIYQGKIADGRFLPVRDSDPSIVARVTAIAADPLAAAVLSGKETGRCSCCSRELTDPVSIANGIGPICASKFFG